MLASAYGVVGLLASVLVEVLVWAVVFCDAVRAPRDSA